MGGVIGRVAEATWRRLVIRCPCAIPLCFMCVMLGGEVCVKVHICTAANHLANLRIYQAFSRVLFLSFFLITSGLFHDYKSSDPSLRKLIN